MKSAKWGCGLLWLATASCTEPLVEPQTIVGLRILGAQVTASAQPESSTVGAGASGTLRWLVAADLPRTYLGLAVWCTEEPSAVGAPACANDWAEIEFAGDTDRELALPFTVPESLADSEGWLSWVGLCEQGVPAWDSARQRFVCDGGGRPIVGVYRGNPQDVSNKNPSLQDDILRLDGQEWGVELGEPGQPCAGIGLLEYEHTIPATIAFEAFGTDAEDLNDDSFAALPIESLEYTHVTTVPGLSRAHSAIDFNAQGSTFDVEFLWSSSEGPPSGGTLVRLYLIVRDGRGGSDWLVRDVCLR